MYILYIKRGSIGIRIIQGLKLKNKQFVLTKRIAKHGRQNIIIIPSFLQDQLKPKTIVKLTIDVVREVEN